MPVDLPAIGGVGGDDTGVLISLVLFVVAVLFLLLLVGLVVPLLLFLAGLVVALLALAARLLSISAWAVSARGRERALAWRVKRLRRSRKAIHEVAERLARGEEPAIDGVAGVSRQAGRS